MANEARIFLGTQKTLEGSGASTANNTIAQANDATYRVATDGANYPDAEFVLVGTFSVAPTEGTMIGLYARPLNVDGSFNTEPPEATRPTYYVGSFVVNNVTTQQAMMLRAEDLPLEAEYYIHNNGTGQTLSAGWTLKIMPRTIGPA